MPTCWIIAGPNGAGKTTFALDYLPKAGCTHFINADLIAAGLSPLAPERELLAASRFFLREMNERVNVRESFAIEMTRPDKPNSRLQHYRMKGQGQICLMLQRNASDEIASLRCA